MRQMLDLFLGFDALFARLLGKKSGFARDINTGCTDTHASSTLVRARLWLSLEFCSILIPASLGEDFFPD